MEAALADDLKKMQAADSQFRKMKQAEDGKKAMLEYEAEAAASRAKTLKLRELRLAKEAADVAAAAASPPPKKAAKKVKRAPVALTDWMKDQQGSGRKS
jgi:hypothetical protein